jgi:hypothetical protein
LAADLSSAAVVDEADLFATAVDLENCLLVHTQQVFLSNHFPQTYTMTKHEKFKQQLLTLP